MIKERQKPQNSNINTGKANVLRHFWHHYQKEITLLLPFFKKVVLL